jgi:hypothetical protein
MGEGVQTHYEILGIGRQASPELVRQAYRRQAQKYHPDRQPGNGEAQQCMARINQAYAVLSDPDGRSAYNRWCDAREGLVAAERAVAQAAPTGFSASWPWFLLALTLAVILVSVGTVLYKEFVPAQVPALAPLRGVAPSGAPRPPSQAGNPRSPAEAAPTAAPAAR